MKNKNLNSKSLKISIVIPTYNEELHLPHLLQSIKEQSLQPFEVIVADAGSKDKTREIAKKYGAKVVKGGMPAVGRNAGAKAAKGDIIVFFDADTVLPENALKNLVNEFLSEKLDLLIITPKYINYDFEDYGFVRDVIRGFIGIVSNVFMKVQRKIKSYETIMGNMMCWLSDFRELGGFPEELKQAEDIAFVKKFLKAGKKVKMSRQTVYVSTRRFKNLKLVFLGVPFLLLSLFFGVITKVTGNNKLEKWWLNNIARKIYGPLGGEG